MQIKQHILFAIFAKDNRVENAGLASVYSPKSMVSYLNKLTKSYIEKIDDDLEWEFNSKGGFISVTAWQASDSISVVAVFKINYEKATITYEGTL